MQNKKIIMWPVKKEGIILEKLIAQLGILNKHWFNLKIKNIRWEDYEDGGYNTKRFVMEFYD